MSPEATATITQLEAARQVVLSDATHYAAVIPGVLPIIGPNAFLEVRRWGAEFLAESFASPALSLQAKESMGIQALQSIHALLDNKSQDEAVVKSMIQTAASIYGPVFRHITNNPQDSQTWSWMSAIKSNILRRFDTDSPGVRICCIKFVQRVVQVQTPGAVPDPRRPDQNEVSSAAVARDHPLIPPSRLEPEASGLLDRLLSVFYEETSEALLVDATLNGFAGLVRSRPTIANKIISAILNFTPLKNVHAGLSPKEKVLLQSMDRTTNAFLYNYMRRNSNSPLVGKIAAQLNKLKQQRIELLDESRKRGPPPAEPTDGLDNTKRARLGAQENGRLNVPPLPPGPVSVAQLYTLTDDEALKSFDVSSIPIDLVVKIALPVLQRVDPGQLDGAINVIRSRFLEISRQPPVQAAAAAAASNQTKLDVEDDDDYEPEFEPVENNEQIINKLDTLPAEERTGADLALGPFELAQPPPMTFEEAEQIGKGAISRVFSMMNKLEPPTKAIKPGLNRLAGSAYDKEAWVTVITRLATRTNPRGKEDTEEGNTDKAVLLRMQEHSLGDGIRETLWKYIIEDFRHRIDIAISWLNEEWYNDGVMQYQPKGMVTAPLSQRQSDVIRRPNYEKWVLKTLDAIIPYLDANDKILVRFLGEIPEVSQMVLERVKNMARDPDRVMLAVKAIYYLAAFKPPTKKAATDAMEDLWKNYADAKASVRPYLARMRPSALEEHATNGVKKEEHNTPTATDQLTTKFKSDLSSDVAV